jgi:hypothetical protein
MAPHRIVLARSLPDHLVSIFHEDFFNNVDLTNDWLLNAHHTSSQANTDDLCGVEELTSHVHDTDDACLHSLHNSWRMQTNKRLSFQSRVRLAKAGGASFGISLSSFTAGDALDDDGAGPNDQTYDGATLFITETNGTMASVWSFLCSNGANKSSVVTFGTYADNTWDVVGWDYDPNDGVTGKLRPYVKHGEGAFVYGPIVDIVISGLDDNMYLHLLLKNGTNNAETLGVDYLTVWQER